MATDLTIGLRIKAFFDEARKAVQDLKKDLNDLSGTGTATGKSLDATAAGASKALGGAGKGGSAGTPAGVDPAPVAAVTQAVTQQTAATAANTAAANANAAASTAAGNAAAGQAVKVRQATATLNAYGISAGQTTNAIRQLPAQFTDIFTSLAGGQNPLLVLIQQGGQIKDSFGGIRPALSQLGQVITPLRLAVAGLGGVVASLGVAFFQARNENEEFNKSLALSGNRIGLTNDQLAKSAENVGNAIRGAQGKAAGVIAQIASTGRVGAANLELVTQAAIKLERVAGQSVEDTVKMFAELGKEPVQAALKYNESLNILTPAVIRQIRALQEQGKTEEAAALAQRTFATAFLDRVSTIEGGQDRLAKGWRLLSELASKAWDNMTGLFRGPTVEQQLATLEQNLANLRERNAALGIAPGRQTAELEAQIAAKRAQIGQSQEQAKADADAAIATERYNDAVKRTGDLTRTKNKELQAALALYRQDVAVRRQRGDVLTDADVRIGETKIRERILGKPSTANTLFREASAEAGIALARLKSELSVLQATIKAEDALIVQALKDGNTGIDQAYAARLAKLQQDNAAQTRILQAEIAEIDQALAKAKTSAERGPLTQRKIDLQARVELSKISLEEAARGLDQWRIDQQAKLDQLTARVRVDVSQLSGVFDRQAFEQQLRLQAKDDLNTARAGGNADDVARIELLIRAGVAQAEFNAKLAETNRLQAALSVQEAAIQNLQSTGQISQIEAEAQVQAARAAQVPQLQAIAAELERIRATLPAEAAAVFDQMTASIGNLRNQATAATPVLVDLGTRLRNTAIDGLADAAATAVTNFKSLREVVAGTLRQIAGDIVRSNVKRLLTDAFTPSSGGGGGGGGSSGGGVIQAGVKFFSTLFGFADGGLIRGPGTGTSDSIPALVGGRKPIAVSDGEFIQSNKAVRKYGVGFMQAVNTLKLPKPAFAFGGLVRSHQQARFATGGMATAGNGSGASSATNLKVELVNNGTPQRVTRQTQTMDGKDTLVRLFLDDLRSGGPMAQGIQGVRNRG